MLEELFASLYGDTITISAFLIASSVSLLLGFLISLVHRKVSDSSGTMSTALTCLPFLIQLVILLVNGNLGAGVAVAGAFSLVRFRSAPGSARDIVTIFLAMAVGLACGMGYVALAVLAAHYHLRLKDTRMEKKLIDQMRCRNGNLEISCGLLPSGREGKEIL